MLQTNNLQANQIYTEDGRTPDEIVRSEVRRADLKKILKYKGIDFNHKEDGKEQLLKICDIYKVTTEEILQLIPIVRQKHAKESQGHIIDSFVPPAAKAEEKQSYDQKDYEDMTRQELTDEIKKRKEAGRDVAFPFGAKNIDLIKVLENDDIANRS